MCQSQLPLALALFICHCPTLSPAETDPDRLPIAYQAIMQPEHFLPGGCISAILFIRPRIPFWLRRNTV
ncbi:hypothetical protein FIBSPDRAFT_876468 [Athelia psychrophila]|uniref:Uncharacterized protein n=1 Tax=Athelia psychrophila TaxID=1759441 RepID=A0A167WVF5_9AGAM|nr:hypothetical protein FIBSPDRAFT_876468 [Fibularhizoctonia sp. CBS 109695]